MTVYLVMLWLICFSFSEFHCAENPPAKKNIIFTQEDINPPQYILAFAYTLEGFQTIIDLANQGDVNSQYTLGYCYFHRINPSQKQDLQKAEEWLLKARNNKFLRAYKLLVSVAMAENNDEKVVNYSLAAGQAGMVEAYYNVAFAYNMKQNYKKAREYFFKTAHEIQQEDTFPFLKQIKQNALVEYAILLMYGKGGPKDVFKALDIFKELAAKNNLQATFQLGAAYFYGNEAVEKNPEEAEKLFLKIINSNDQTPNAQDAQIQAINFLGVMYEKGFGNLKPNIQKAIEYYKKEYDYLGKFHIARLILNGKIKGNQNESKKLLEDSFLKNPRNKLAGYLYGTFLLLGESPEEGIATFEKIKQQGGYVSPLVLLQLAIAYHFGFGTDQNEEKSKELFQLILNDQDDSKRSIFLVRGYMRFLGLGVAKDIKKAFALIEESENKVEDVYFTVDELFPAIAKFKSELAAQELLAEEEKAKKKKEKIEHKSPKQLSNEPIQKNINKNPFKVTVQEWNAYFDVKDGSRVIKIDAEKNIFVIHDPQRNEQLLVMVNKLPARDFTEIEGLKFDQRIFERQGLGKIKLSHQTTYDHSFAEMLDYVIQFVGEIVPFSKEGGKKKQDQLTVKVIRKNVETGEELLCTAEYTFYQKGEELFVYHRLLRPIKRKSASSLLQTNVCITEAQLIL